MAEQQPPQWNDRSLAGWLKSAALDSLTLSQCWRIAHELSRGPLADVWLRGVAEGERRAGSRLERDPDT